MTHVYCTYFDSGYLSRGVAMMQSLRTAGADPDAEIVVLALDDAAADALAALADRHLTVIRLADIEAAFPDVTTVKDSRTRMEYLFTLTPWLTTYAMDQRPDCEWVTYLDADLWFFSDVAVIYEEMSRGSVGIVAHRFTPEQAWREQYGHYNVGWVSFRNDADGRTCLRWWADSCLEWCFDRPEDGKFADQGYLDSFADVVESVVVIGHPGVDTAPWNLAGHVVTRDAEGRPLVDGVPLVVFHFHGLSRHGRRFRFKHLSYGAPSTDAIRHAIYAPYCTRLAELDTGASATGRDRQRDGLNAFGRARVAFQTWKGDRRGDFVDV